MLFADLSLAQTVPTPGGVRDTLPRREAPLSPEELAPLEAPDRAAPGDVPAGGPAIAVERFEITGNTVIPTEELLGVVSQYVGQRLTLLELYGVADVLSNYYRSKGYTLATVVLPAQKVDSGTIVLEVIEGRIDKLEFEGNSRYSSERLRRFVKAVSPGDVLESAELKRDLFRLNELPGLSSRAIIRPGKEYGTSEVIVRSRERLLQGNAYVNNYGREAIGEWRLDADLGINNPLGWGDLLQFTVSHAEGGLLDFGRVDYDLPLGYLGTRARIYYSRYDYDVDTKTLGPAFAGTQLSGNGDDFGLSLRHPVWNDSVRSLFVSVGVDRTLIEQKGTLVVPPFDKTDITLMTLGADYAQLLGNGAFATLGALLSTNFDQRDGLEESAQTAKLAVRGSYLLPLDPAWSVLVRGAAVVAADTLVDTERFRIGGQGSVRAFPSAELAGDQGVMASVEVQRRLLLGGRVPAIARLFYDAGIVHRKQRAAGEKSTESLNGIGVGVSGRIARHFGLDAEVVRPLGNRDVSDGEDDVRAWLRLSAGF